MNEIHSQYNPRKFAGQSRSVMKHLRISTAAVALTLALLLPTSVFAKGLDGFLGEINVSAKSDPGRFRADLSATFGVSSGEVDGLFKIFKSPADVYITLRIGQVADVKIGRVVDQYRSHKGQGWGVIAKNLGIKPGSSEFHALKQGRLGSHKHGGTSAKSGPGKSAGKSKGRK
jgi:hypothetical protein